MSSKDQRAGTSASSDALPQPDELNALLEKALRLPALAPSAPRLRALIADFARDRRAVQTPLVLALVGATGAGKSTLLNALAGETLAIEGTTRPTSREVVIYAPLDANVSALGVGADVSRYRPRAMEPWAGQIFVDTPDVNSVEQAHRERARAVVENADVAIAVMHKGAVVEAAQVEFLRNFAQRRRLLFVLNFADELLPESREQLKRQVRQVAAAQLGLAENEVPIFAISALSAKRGEDPSGEWPLLYAALRSLGREAEIERVRAGNAAGILRELSGVITPALTRTETARNAVAQALDANAAGAAKTLRKDFADRLDRSRGHLRTEVRRAAAGRWWGPAAWWMRLSALGAGGLGGAALVARHNLPVGLAVAAVSTAIDKLKDQTLAAAADRRVISEADPALVETARAAVTSARVIAQQQGLGPDLVGLPSAAALLEQLEDARGQAWAYTEREAVSAVVHTWWRWARFLLLPLVNLPLFALLCHVAYNVVRSYLYGPPYLGLDYFLNVGALTGVLSAGGALLASLSLLGAASRVRAAALKRFEVSVQRIFSELSATAYSALESELTAARRLASF
ncbi:MAG: GTPase [Myxococcaceae bacterium]